MGWTARPRQDSNTDHGTEMGFKSSLAFSPPPPPPLPHPPYHNTSVLIWNTENVCSILSTSPPPNSTPTVGSFAWIICEPVSLIKVPLKRGIAFKLFSIFFFQILQFVSSR